MDIEKNKSLVVKSNGLVRAKYTLTKNEQRLVLYAISKIQPDDEDFREYRLTLSEIADLTGISRSRAYSDAVRLTTGLANKAVKIPTGKGEVLISHWLSDVLINDEKDSFVFTISKKMKPYLLGLKERFTAYRIESVLGFESKYGFRVYEICKQFEHTGLAVLTVQDFREMLELENKYSVVTTLKKYVINPALNDINTHSDLIVEPKYRKRRQAITHIEFHIQPKDGKAKIAKAKSARPKAETKPSGPDPAVLAAEKEIERKNKESGRRVAGWKKEWEDLDEEARSNYQGGWLCYLKFKSTGRV